MNKKISILSILLLAMQFAFAQNNTKEVPKLFQPSVLIELFSSEGCSSCPYADEFLKEVVQISDSSRTPVYVIDYHVVIWNRSGWVDPFSDSAYSLRQQEYLYRKKISTLYTPMVFVNGGDKEFAGGDKRSIGKAIQELLTQPSKHFLRTGITKVKEEDSLLVAYQIWGNVDSCDLKVAFIQKEINNMVTGGENKDMILHHHNVVRGLFSKPLTGAEGYMKIPVDQKLNLDNYRVVVFIQHQGTWKVLAADQMTFKP